MTQRTIGTPVAWCLAAATVVAVSACSRNQTDTAVDDGRVGVTVQEARNDTLRDVASVSGTVVPSTVADWTIVATDTAEIVELPKKAKEVVAPGDLLVRLDIPSLTQEMSALELGVLDANARLDRAKAELARQEGFLGRGLTARTTYDAARLEHATAESQLAQARTRLDSAKATENRAEIRARFGGVITEVFRAVGDQVRPTPEDAILRVIDPTRVQVSVQIPLAQLARIVNGQTATVQAIAGVAKETATVVSKADAASANAPTGEVRLAFVGAPTLPIDTPVSVEILLDQRSNVLVVPVAAVRRDDLGSWLMIAGADGVARRRDVRLGLVTTEAAQVLAGLQAGEQVITSGLTELEDGTPILLAR